MSERSAFRQERFSMDRDGVHLIFPKSAYVNLEEAARDFAECIGSPEPVPTKRGSFLVGFDGDENAYHVGRYGDPHEIREGVFDYEVLARQGGKKDPNLTKFEAKVKQVLKEKRVDVNPPTMIRR